MNKYLSLVLFALILNGCVTIASDDSLEGSLLQSQVTVSDQLGIEARDSQWWDQFEDQQLSDLVEITLNANPELEIARANVAAAYAIFADNDNDDLLLGSADGVYSNQDQVLPGFTTERVAIDSYQVGGNLGWNLDLFGKLEFAAQSSLADAEAQYFAWRDVQIALAAQVANTYAEFKGAIARKEFALRNLDTTRQTYQVVSDRVELGFSSDLDLLRVESQLRALESVIPAFESESLKAHNTLAALTGQIPSQLVLSEEYSDGPNLVQPLAIGDSDNLLVLRPDVLKAERELASAVALTQSQQADLYPDISITGFLGFLAPSLSQLDGGSEAWSIAPALGWSAFDMGSVRARIDAASANEIAAAANFESTVLNALAEAQTALDTYVKSQERLNLIDMQVSTSVEALDIARLQFEAGIIDLLDLLDVERVLIESQDTHERIKMETFMRLVDIYQAFGGGLGEGELTPTIVKAES